MTFDDFTSGLPDGVRDSADAVSHEVYDELYPPSRPSPVSRLSEIRRRMVRLDSIEPVLTVNYLVKGWLSAGGLSMLFGPSNAGKTFVALDIAMHVAAGKPWRDCRTNQGEVLYIAAEGGAGVLNRLAAFKAENPGMAQAPFTLLPIGLDLHGSEDAKIVNRLLSETKPVLIVVDTLARSIGEGDENTAKDAAMFVKNCDLIRNETGAHVMVIHHTGKDEDRGARGSSALRAAVDSEILVSSQHCISSQKQRDMAVPDSLHFTLRSVTLGTDEDGDPVTSAVVEPAEKPPHILKPLSGKNQVAMTALGEALREHGRDGMGVQMKITRKALKQSGTGLEQAVRRDMSAAIEQEVDRVIFHGTGAGGEPLGVFPGAATYGITETAVDAAASYAAFRAAAVRFMTANAANSLDAINLALRPEVFDSMDDVLLAGTAVSEWDRLIAKLRNVVLTTNGIEAPAGDPAASKALLTTATSGVSPIFCGMWGAVDMIRDPYSEAKSGQLVLTALTTVDVTVARGVQLEILTGVQ